MSEKSQLELVANYIMADIEGEPSRDEGAGKCAVRLLKHYRDAMKRAMSELGIPQPDYPSLAANAHEILRYALKEDPPDLVTYSPAGMDSSIEYPVPGDSNA